MKRKTLNNLNDAYIKEIKQIYIHTQYKKQKLEIDNIFDNKEFTIVQITSNMIYNLNPKDEIGIFSRYHSITFTYKKCRNKYIITWLLCMKHTKILPMDIAKIIGKLFLFK